MEYLQPFGLILDIIGFILVIKYGHAIFMRISSKLPESGEGNDGDVYLIFDGNGESDNSKQRKLAYLGAALVVIGFVSQLIASIL